MFLGLINIPVFIVSLALGIFVVYITHNQQAIYIYPNPDNLNKFLYKDQSDNCFKFKAKEVDCPENEKLIREYDVQ